MLHAHSLLSISLFTTRSFARVQDEDAKRCCLSNSSLANPAFRPKAKTTPTKQVTTRRTIHCTGRRNHSEGVNYLPGTPRLQSLLPHPLSLQTLPTSSQAFPLGPGLARAEPIGCPL